MSVAEVAPLESPVLETLWIIVIVAVGCAILIIILIIILIARARVRKQSGIVKGDFGEETDAVVCLFA